jgi:acyl carrier protein|tara:strand:+ start:1810 stop:2055 length:246 start_codon:yes stop_codon:yes gene_type:complete
MKKNLKIDLKFMEIIFKKALNNKSKITLSSKFEKVKGWDSLGHMKVISEIEDKLKISFEIDEIIGVDSVKKLIDLSKTKIM